MNSIRESLPSAFAVAKAALLPVLDGRFSLLAALFLFSASTFPGVGLLMALGNGEAPTVAVAALWLAPSLGAFLLSRPSAELMGLRVDMLGLIRFFSGWAVVVSGLFLAGSLSAAGWPVAAGAAAFGVIIFGARRIGGLTVITAILVFVTGTGIREGIPAEKIPMYATVFGASFLPVVFAGAVCSLLAISFHEWAHARAALFFGDRTALNAGRVTVNPASHFSFVGMVAFPAALIAAGSPLLFGWARPVPFNPGTLRNRRYGTAALAAAGPLCNIALAALGAAVTELLISPERGTFLHMLCWGFVVINAGLGGVNLLPIPPLDGGKIALALAPISNERYEALSKKEGLFLLPLLGLLLVAPWVLSSAFGISFDPFTPIRAAVDAYLDLITGGEHIAVLDWVEGSWDNWIKTVTEAARPPSQPAS